MIVLNNVCKDFGEKRVLDNISFHIAPGERVGIIGRNGAGKTTLLNIIAGMLRPDSGFLRVNGTENPLEHYDALRELSYVSGTRGQLWEDLTVKHSLENCAKMYGVDKLGVRARLEALEDVFGVQAFMDSLPGSLSLGEKMRCELVYGLLSNPKILMLDEALIGLDASVKYKIIEYFKQYGREQNSTLLYTSHNLIEVEQICERVLLIDKGSIIFDGSIDRIIKEFAPLYRVEVTLQGKIPDFEDLPIQKFSLKEDTLLIDYDKRKIDTAQILKHVMEQSRIGDVKLSEPDLERTIQNIYERKR